MNLQKAKEEAQQLSLYIFENYDKIDAPFDLEWQRLQFLRTFILMETLNKKNTN